MVKINVHSQEVLPASTTYTPRVNEDGGAISRGLTMLGGATYEAFGRLAADEQERLDKKKRADDSLWVSKAASDLAMAQTERLREESAKAPLGAKDFTQNFMPGYDDYVAKSAEGAPSDEARAAYQEYANRYRVDTFDRSLRFEADSGVAQRKLELGQTIDTVTNVVRSDSSQYDTLRAELLTQIESMEIPATEKATMVMAAEQSLTGAVVQADIDSNPWAAEKLLNSGEYDARLSNEQKSAYLNMAQSEIKQREAQARAAEAARISMLRDDVDDAVYLLSRGQVPPNSAQLLAAVKGTVLEEKLAAGLRYAPAAAEFATKAAGRPEGQAILNDLITAQRANPTAELQRSIEALTTVHENAKRELANDPMSYAISVGSIIPPPRVPWTGAPEPLLESLQIRQKTAAELQSVTGRPTAPFTDEDLAALTTTYQSLDANAKVGFLNVLQTGLGDEVMATVADALAPKDRMLSYLAGMTTKGEKQWQLVRTALKGSELLKEDPALRPEAIEIQKMSSDALGTALVGSPQVQAATQDAAVALAAQYANGDGDLTKEGVRARYDAALEAIIGGPTVSWGPTGNKILPPLPGVSQYNFSLGMRTIQMEDLVEFGNGAPVYGHSGIPFKLQDVEASSLVQAGDGKYMFFIQGQGFIFNAQGDPYVFNGAAYFKAPLRPRPNLQWPETPGIGEPTGVP